MINIKGIKDAEKQPKYKLCHIISKSSWYQLSIAKHSLYLENDKNMTLLYTSEDDKEVEIVKNALIIIIERMN